MEYAKDEIFNVRYNTKLNRLQIEQEGWTSKIHKKIKAHKLITTAVLAFFIFSIINIVMIYNFMKILQGG